MNEVILFEHSSFRGKHRHFFQGEPDLGHKEDSSLNDRVSSIIVVSGTWAFYRDKDYHGEYKNRLGPGIYAWVGNHDIKNDDMSSLRPV